MKNGQLVLPVLLKDSATFANFFSLESNQQAIIELQALPENDGFSSYFLCGEKGAGISHLLQSIVNEYALQAKTAQYLPLSQLQHYDPKELFEGLESLDLICIDDIDCVAGRQEWEEALFHCYNRAQLANCCLVFGGSNIPAMLGFSLADLVSRLEWGHTIRIEPCASDQALSALLMFRAKCRGMQMPQEVASFLLLRWQRDLVSLIAVLDHLDKESLQDQRRLTIPYIKQVLGL